MTTGCHYLKTQLERIKKSLQKIFEDFGLEIVADSNLRIVNYLDVTRNLNGGSFRPCNKPDIIQHINKESNHPLNLIKHLPAFIEKWLSNNSSDEKVFKESAIYYEDTLNKTGYIDKLIYIAPSASNQENKNKNHQRNVIWFNPPYSKSVTTRIDQSFLYQIDIHLAKIDTFNRNKVKVSYCFIQNIKVIINNHNMNILHQSNEIKDECNCRNKKYCPLDWKCLSPTAVYEGKITLTQLQWQSLLSSCRKVVQRPNPLPMKITRMTEFSKEYWEVKRSKFIPKVTWSTVRECPPYNLSKKKNYFCLNEKLEINSYNGNNLLNKRSELINKCRYLKEHTLLRHDSKD